MMTDELKIEEDQEQRELKAFFLWKKRSNQKIARLLKRRCK